VALNSSNMAMGDGKSHGIIKLQRRSPSYDSFPEPPGIDASYDDVLGACQSPAGQSTFPAAQGTRYGTADDAAHRIWMDTSGFARLLDPRLASIHYSQSSRSRYLKGINLVAQSASAVVGLDHGHLNLP
jgi:hypothetical protein